MADETAPAIDPVQPAADPNAIHADALPPLDPPPVDLAPAPADIPADPAPNIPDEEPAVEAAPPVDNDHVAPGATLFTDEEIAANAPAIPDEPAAESDAFARFRMHWRGGERRLAMELVKAGEFAEAEFAALAGEFPEIIDILNGN
jgi:hypothetical protein